MVDKSDIPTAETLSHGVYKEEPIKPVVGSPRRVRNLWSQEIDRLFYLGRLSQDHHCTLENFKKDLMRAGMIFTPRAGLEPGGTSGHAQFISDAAFSRVARVSTQMKAIRARLSSDDTSILLDVLMQDIKLPEKQDIILTTAAEVLGPMYQS